ncbi:MAG: hypothetical protein HC895_06690 [Leptolyngbyaceae cyanobacterium SM1_3_5]|nr:hypothetical protein [Leptolyngbyaceae cyanobacterium SM1_3_5]
MQEEDILVDRRKSPDFQQISGHIDKSLVRQFKTFCTGEDITIAEALEDAIALYLKSKGIEPQKHPSTTQQGQ